MRPTRCLLLLPLLLASLSPAHAQETAGAAVSDEAQAPQIVQGKLMRTARLFRFDGDVQVQRNDNTGEDPAVLNMPLPAGTRVTTGDYAQAEIEFDDGSTARLTPRSALSIDVLGMDVKEGVQSEITLLSGLAYFELRHVQEADWIIQAGQVIAEPTSNSVVRVGLDQQPGTFAVISGSLKVASMATDPDSKDTGFTATVRTGESLRADADDVTRYFLNRQIEPQAWDSWNQTRDDHAADAASTRTSARDDYAANQAYGWSDLDANGTWYSGAASPADANEEADAQGGSGDLVWQPAAAADDNADFDPYGDGDFVWSGTSYVWASAYSWGWTPYRCGRWEYYSGLGWVWRPNRFCLTFGYGGYSGVFIGHRHPPRYQRIYLPISKPGPVHPIIRVKSPTPRPVKPHEAAGTKVALLNGRALDRLQPVGPVSGSGVISGRVLFRDFPVDAKSHKPVIGLSEKVPGSEAVTPITGWITRRSTPQPGTGNPPPRILRTPIAGAELRPAQPTARPSPAPASPRSERPASPPPAPASRTEAGPPSPSKPK